MVVTVLCGMIALHNPVPIFTNVNSEVYHMRNARDASDVTTDRQIIHEHSTCWGMHARVPQTICALSNAGCIISARLYYYYATHIEHSHVMFVLFEIKP